MKITEVNIVKNKNKESRMKAVASVLIDESFVIHDIRIIEGDNGLFLAMPSRKVSTGGYKDVAHPINQTTRSMFEEKVIAKYKEMDKDEK